MATNSMVPYSNPAGNNQMTPPGLMQGGSPGATGVVAPTPTNPVLAQQQNPLVPAGAAPPTGVVNPGLNQGGSTGATRVVAPSTGTVVPGAVNSGTNPGSVFNAGSTTTNESATQTQESNIYGQGIGTDITNLLGSIGGTDSTTLQEYEQSLVPQEATAQANLNASLGAGGVSANSSVAALGDANLQAQETSAIAGETAQLTQSGQNLEASILTGQEQAAEQEVSESGWSVFGQVLGDIGGLGASTVAAAGKVGGFSNLF
jgi:hypothetical protein